MDEFSSLDVSRQFLVRDGQSAITVYSDEVDAQSNFFNRNGQKRKLIV
jgi:hypothetical protein